MRKIALVALLAATAICLPSSAGADSGELFERTCSTCHGKDGKGDTAIGKKKGLRPLGSPEVQAQSDAALTNKIANGGENGDRQHAFKNKGLSNEDIAELVTFVRALPKTR